MRHVFYRQFYRPPIGAVFNASPVAAKGVWLVGAELGLHYDSDGALVFVFGTQFEDVEMTNIPVIVTATDARPAALAAAIDSARFTPRDPEDLAPPVVDSQR